MVGLDREIKETYNALGTEKGFIKNKANIREWSNEPGFLYADEVDSLFSYNERMYLYRKSHGID